MKARRRAMRPGSMEPGRTHRTVPRTRPEYGGYTFLEVIPDVEAASLRLERALTLTSALEALDAANECEHGGLPVDRHPQPGCTPACPGYPQHLRRPAKPLPTLNGRAIGVHQTADGLMQKVLCACGRTWTRRAVRGRVPKCPDCRGLSENAPSPTKEK